jgi:hypothetical protein
LIKPSPQNLRMLIQNPTGTLSKQLLGWKNHGLQLPIQTRVRLLSRTLKEHSSIRLRLRVQKALMNAVLLQLIHFRVVAFGNRQSSMENMQSESINHTLITRKYIILYCRRVF